MKSLREAFSQPEDIDIAQHHLAVLLGMVKDDKTSFSKDNKWVYWTNNPYGNALCDILFKLVDIGLLYYDDEEQRFWSNPDFIMNSRNN